LAEEKRERGFREWLLLRVRMLYYIGRGEEDRLFTIYLFSVRKKISDLTDILNPI
jgi:hypothetical protein